MIHDLSAWGEQNTDGTALSLVDDAALNNAIVSFLMSSKGDYILDPTIGGPLRDFSFKNMDTASIEKLRFSIRNALYMKFDDLIELKAIDIIPDYTNKLSEINIVYVSLLSDEQKSATVYVKDTSKVNYVTYQEIIYTGDNLYTFVQIKKSDMLGKKLAYNTKELAWIWGSNLKFTNFTISDTRFDDILALCNT